MTVSTQVVLAIGDKINALPILERCVQENFERNVRRECDLWIEQNGQSDIGATRQDFYASMLSNLGQAFTINGYCE